MTRWLHNACLFRKRNLCTENIQFHFIKLEQGWGGGGWSGGVRRSEGVIFKTTVCSHALMHRLVRLQSNYWIYTTFYIPQQCNMVTE